MTTNHVKPGHYYYLLNENNQWENYSNTKGVITNRSRNGQYNIIEKNFGDHKQFYYIPATYDSDYDISQLDDVSSHEEEEQQQHYPSTVIRRRNYQQYDDELPRIPSRRYVYVTPRRPQIIKRVYYEPPSKTVDYTYRSRNEDIIKYSARDRGPRQRYIKESQPIRQSAYVENLPPIRHSPLNELFSPRRSKIKQQSPWFESSNRTIIRDINQQKHMSLKDVLAQNRARRGPRIPKPRREVDEDEFYDPPTYHRNYIKNGFIVHK